MLKTRSTVLENFFGNGGIWVGDTEQRSDARSYNYSILGWYIDSKRELPDIVPTALGKARQPTF